MDKQIFKLCDANREQAAQAFLDAPDGWIMELRPATRSLDQNAMLHGCISNVAKQTKYMGRILHPLQWKTLFISGHAIATGRGADMVPGMEGEFVNIRESSAQMSIARMASLLEYVLAYCANKGIRLPAPKGYEAMGAT